MSNKQLHKKLTQNAKGNINNLRNEINNDLEAVAIHNR
jgi:hypothetical protein